MELERLAGLIDLLRRKGVYHYRTPDLELVLGPEPMQPVKDVLEQEEARIHRPEERMPGEKAPRALPSIYDDPALWPDGKRPQLPTKD